MNEIIVAESCGINEEGLVHGENMKIEINKDELSKTHQVARYGDVLVNRDGRYEVETIENLRNEK